MSSCRADMSNTLAQKCHCELWSGAYLTCKNSPVHLTGMGVRSEGNFQWSFWLKVAEAFSSNKVRLRKRCRKWWTKNGVEVLGLSLFPCQKVIKIDSRHVTVVSRGILFSCMELRWRQPCSDPVAPCKKHAHTHTHAFDQNSHCELWCGMQRSCRNTNTTNWSDEIEPRYNVSANNHSRHWR